MPLHASIKVVEIYMTVSRSHTYRHTQHTVLPYTHILHHRDTLAGQTWHMSSYRRKCLKPHTFELNGVIRCR